MRGNTKPALYAQHSCSPLEIKGHFQFSGPQLIGGEGGLPLWAAAVLEDPKITGIAIMREHGGTVIQRLKAE